MIIEADADGDGKVFVCLCWGFTSQSTIFQSCRDGATASWVINRYFRGVKCLAQGHNTAAVGIEPPTSRSGVRHSTTEPPRSPNGKVCFACRKKYRWLLRQVRIVMGRSVMLVSRTTGDDYRSRWGWWWEGLLCWKEEIQEMITEADADGDWKVCYAGK